MINTFIHIIYNEEVKEHVLFKEILNVEHDCSSFLIFQILKTL
jgi:predicted SAM-dependent methyltransferase